MSRYTRAAERQFDDKPGWTDSGREGRMDGNAWGYLVLVAASLVVALLVYGLVRRSLRGLLDKVVAIPAGTTFYSRMLAIVLLFVALNSVLDKQFDFKQDAAFMEYVWRIAGVLATEFGLLCIIVAVYLVLITILVAALGRRNEQ
jgi:hypothetical protein